MKGPALTRRLLETLVIFLAIIASAKLAAMMTISYQVLKYRYRRPCECAGNTSEIFSGQSAMEGINWSGLGAMGEMFGAFGVLASIVYFATVLRFNANVTRDATTYNIMQMAINFRA